VAGNFSSHHRVQSGAHSAGAFSLGIKRPGREADHSSSSSAEVECVELHIHSPNTPSWRGAQLMISACSTCD
jgi:hypothetical protein